jgi:hypothetical protein
MGALVWIGFLAGELVYRTTNTFAYRKNAFLKVENLLAKYVFFIDMEEMGVFRIHWPPLFPNIGLPECDFLQIDVTIGTQV